MNCRLNLKLPVVTRLLREQRSIILKAAAKGRYEEWNDLYPEFAKVAEEEDSRRSPPP